MENRTLKNNLESFLLSWNHRFRYDRLWRRKYNIPFLSEKHLQANQIDIYLDMLEDRLYDRAQDAYEQKQKDSEAYKKGSFLKEEVLSIEEEDKLFKKARLK